MASVKKNRKIATDCQFFLFWYPPLSLIESVWALILTLLSLATIPPTLFPFSLGKSGPGSHMVTCSSCLPVSAWPVCFSYLQLKTGTPPTSFQFPYSASKIYDSMSKSSSMNNPSIKKKNSFSPKHGLQSVFPQNRMMYQLPRKSSLFLYHPGRLWQCSS